MRKIYFWELLTLFVVFLISSCTQDNILEPVDETNEPPAPIETAYTVSYEEALLSLQEVLNELDAPETRSSGEKRKIANHYTVGQPVGEVLTRSSDSERPDPFVYIFNFENEAGYAIVSGDKRTPSILAVTEKGELAQDKEVENPGLIVFLTNMEELYYEYIDEYEEKPVTRATWIEYELWNQGLLGSSGLSFNDWGQGYPYNDLVPKINGSAPPAGCTATATAILMAFHKYPSYSNGYSYNWDEMVKHRPMETSVSYSPAYPQIARLFQQLGLPHNLDMTYRLTGGSGAWEDNIPRTLKNFGYSNGGTFADYNQKTVIDELYSGYALAISAYAIKTVKKKKVLGITVKTTTSYSEGHTWVLDRLMFRFRHKLTINNGTITKKDLETQYLVRCNYGWSGSDNGYYFAGAFDTNAGPVVTRSGTSGNYQYDIDIVYNIRK